MMTLSNISLLMNHPISLGLVLLIQSLMISINSSFLSNNSWFSYILFIIMIGGLMIIFIYMTSISNNLKFKIKIKEFIMFLTLTSISFYIKNNLNINSNKLFNENEISYFLLKFFSSNKFLIIFLISYLFITLIAISKLTLINSGPLRKI
uniref:NADH-ubiquinone oxidoreductase chain 6 n=1 Tax=Elateroidea sp. 8 KM-2017 TaxID=2219431 RepID=A0A346RHG1_9COLE|nr:NADH dehydrogenase subunit 6 [Elateroidea sp. 8 KM-2017]